MHIVRVQWAVCGVGGSKSNLREIASVGLVAAAAGQLEDCSVLSVIKQTGLWDFVTGTQNKITEDEVEDSALENGGGAHESRHKLVLYTLEDF